MAKLSGRDAPMIFMIPICRRCSATMAVSTLNTRNPDTISASSPRLAMTPPMVWAKPIWLLSAGSSTKLNTGM